MDRYYVTVREDYIVDVEASDAVEAKDIALALRKEEVGELAWRAVIEVDLIEDGVDHA